MDPKPPVPKKDPRLLGFLLMGQFIFLQVILILLLKFTIAPEHQPSWSGFLTAVRSDVLYRVFVIFSAVTIFLQQFLRSRFLEGEGIKLQQLIILLVLAEVPGLLGFSGAIVGDGNVSFAVPLIVASIVSFMTLKPIVLKLKF
jgi:hypothetical protein